jgi:hypothetical protein
LIPKGKQPLQKCLGRRLFAFFDRLTSEDRETVLIIDNNAVKIHEPLLDILAAVSPLQPARSGYLVFTQEERFIFSK